ncbi:MAG: amino acid ABC transporter ATP-binding protein [Eubacterium sp.]|nr:amino acid ABC transporter ATP-binding protein [Eubacterium sp.]
MRIKLDRLTKAFGGHMVLDHIDFEDDFSTLAVIGSSGGGKSTLLRILAGLIPPTSGHAMLDGKSPEGKASDQLAYRRQMGFVFQQNGLLKHLTAIENITMPLIKVHGLGKGEAEKRAKDLLIRFGLEKERDKYPYALSGGQSQRIAIARAIAPNPVLLLLDEPTSALDPEYTVEVLDMIRELKEEGRNFIIVTHEMGFARKACEKTMFLHEGRISEYGLSDSLFASPATDSLKKFLATLLEWNVK